MIIGHEQEADEGADKLHDDEAEHGLGVGPMALLPGLVVEGRQQPHHEGLAVEGAHDGQLEKAQSPVQQDHDGKGDAQQEVPGLKHQNAHEEADGPAAGVAHHNEAGGRVEEEVCKHTPNEHQGAEGPFLPVTEGVEGVAQRPQGELFLRLPGER